CPFEFTVDVAIAHVRARIDAGLVDPDRDFQPEHRHLSAHGALAELERLRPDREDLVVCHGDYCPPNVIVAADEVNGYVDLGELARALVTSGHVIPGLTVDEEGRARSWWWPLPGASQRSLVATLVTDPSPAGQREAAARLAQAVDAMVRERLVRAKTQLGARR